MVLFISVVTMLYKMLPGRITLYLHSTLRFKVIDCICGIRADVRCTKRDVRYELDIFYTVLPFCVIVHIIHKHLGPTIDTNICMTMNTNFQ